jgi:photosystem II stability/assembly factor-like uncharacterized protein
MGGYLKYLAHTSDGGESWELIRRTDRASMMNDIYFANSQEGWAVGSSRMILHTTDGGQTWEAHEYTNVGDQYSMFKGIQFISPQIGFVVGTRGAFLKTTDGGQTWFPFGADDPDVPSIPLTWSINDVFFISEDEGCLAGYLGTQNGRIFCTQNGGRTWHELKAAGDRAFAGMNQFVGITAVVQR